MIVRSKKIENHITKKPANIKRLQSDAQRDRTPLKSGVIDICYVPQPCQVAESPVIAGAVYNSAVNSDGLAFNQEAQVSNPLIKLTISMTYLSWAFPVVLSA